MTILKCRKIRLYQVLASILLASLTFEAAAFDAVTCSIEQTAFRQLCKIDGIDHSQTFNLAAHSEFRGYKFDVASILKNPKLSFEGADGILNLDLLGLQPILEFDTNFINLDACRQSTLWKDRIAVYLRLPDGSEVLASDVIVGAKHHVVDLSSSSLSPKAKFVTTVTPDGSHISIETKYFFKNHDDFPGRTVSIKRMPPECKLNVFNQQVGFDAVDINVNLQSLKLYTASVDQSVLKSTVLNGMYLKQNAGAVCAVEKLSSTLYSVEALPLTESPEQLSLPSQQAIADAVSYAVSLGAIAQESIPKDESGAPLYFDYYRKAENRERLTTECKSILDDLVVNKTRFLASDGVTITNESAYKNALDYERGIRNLKKIIDAAWALVSVARMDVENSKDLDWLLDPKLYGLVISSNNPN
jgi:hypothetical protein